MDDDLPAAAERAPARSSRPAPCLARAGGWLRPALVLVTAAARERPLAACAIGFAAGCACLLPPALAASALRLALLLGSGGCALLLLAALTRSRSDAALAAALLSLGVCVGVARSASLPLPSAMLSGASARAAFAVGALPQLATLRGEVVGEPSATPGSVFFLLRADSVAVDGAPARRCGGVVVAARCTGGAMLAGPALARLQPGMRVAADGVLDALPPPTPGSASAAWQTLHGVGAQLSARRAGAVTLSPPTSVGGWLLMACGQARARAELILGRALPTADAEIVEGVVFGDRAGIAPDVLGAFLATGTVHLLATAGLHVGIVLLCLRAVCRALTLPPKAFAALAIVTAAAYAVMTGGRPAATRAACVAAIYCGALLLERLPDLPTALAVTAAALLWNEPAMIGDVGFLLTFVTVIGIVAAMPTLAALVEALLGRVRWRSPKLRHAARRLLELQCLSVAAQCASAPLTAVYFNLVSPLSLPANLLAVPLMFLVVPLTLLTVAAGVIAPPLATVIGHEALGPVVRLLTGVVTGIASLPGCAVSLPSPGWGTVTAYYGVLLGGGLAMRLAAGRAAKAVSARPAASSDGAVVGRAPLVGERA